MLYMSFYHPYVLVDGSLTTCHVCQHNNRWSAELTELTCLRVWEFCSCRTVIMRSQEWLYKDGMINIFYPKALVA